jgi:hypothetical protein
MKLGDRIKFTARLERKTRSAGEGRGWNRKCWERRDHDPAEGVFIGTRTLQDGVREWDSEYGWSWCKDRHFEAALVVFSERQAPVHVPIECISPV